MSSILDTLAETVRGSGPETSDSKYENARTHLLKYDISRSSYFDVWIGNSSKAIYHIQDFETNERVFESRFVCHSAELPGESIATVQQKIYGVIEKYPVMAGYNDINLGFYTYGSGIEQTRNYFLSWMTSITGRHEQRKSNNGSPKGLTTYNVQYKSEYARDIIITQYAISGHPLLQVKLIDAFPISINQARLSWQDQNSALSLAVTFAYTEYEYLFYKVEGSGNYSRGVLDPLITSGIQGIAAVNTISGAIKSKNPFAIGSILPGIGLSNFTLSSLTNKIGL